jgi:ABC-2 type transport system ATP-binding protein
LTEPQDIVVDGAEVESRTANVVRLRFDRRTISADQLIRRITENYSVTDVSIEEPELESIIRRIYVEGYTTQPSQADRT